MMKSSIFCQVLLNKIPIGWVSKAWRFPQPGKRKMVPVPVVSLDGKDVRLPDAKNTKVAREMVLEYYKKHTENKASEKIL